MRIIESVGAIDVEPSDGGVTIEQQSLDGQAPAVVFIPDVLLDAVIRALRKREVK